MNCVGFTGHRHSRAISRLNHNLAAEPLLLAALSIQKTLTHANARITLNVLLRASLVLVAHMHDGSGFTTVHFVTEETAEFLVDLAGRASDRPLLSGTVLAWYAIHRLLAASAAREMTLA